MCFRNIESMKYASIDMGTNTFRLLVAEVGPDGVSKPIVCRRAITRLGGGYTEEHGIDREAAHRAFNALDGFVEVLLEHSITDVTAAATSVVRRAVNRDWFASEVLRRTGIRLTVISGQEEARLSLLGVLSVTGGAHAKSLVIDIGGGSTEYVAAAGPSLAGAWSMEMGVVHLTERYLASNPPKRSELDSMSAEISATIAVLKEKMVEDGIDPCRYCATDGAALIGTAGTVTTLAAIDLGLEAYDAAKVNNYTLTRKRVGEIYEHLARLTLKEREGILSLEKGREDLIMAGCAITLLSMEAFGFDELVVSDAGLLEGIIIDRASRDATPQARP